MYGPLIVAAAILLSIAGIVLFLHDLSEARVAQGVRPHLRGGKQAAPLRHAFRVHRGRSGSSDPPQDADPGRGAAAKRATDAPGRPTAL